MHKINMVVITADHWKLVLEAVKSSSNYLTIFPSNGNLWKSFWATMSLSISVPYRFRKIFISSLRLSQILFILNQNIHVWQELKISDSPARKCVFWSLPLDVAIIWLIYIARFVWSLKIFAFEGLNTKLSLNVFLAWYIVTPSPLWF